MEDALITYKDVEVRQQELGVLEHVDLELGKGEFVYLIGKVGSGKTSLLKTFYGELEVTEGEALVLGHDMSHIKRKHIPQLRRKLGIIFQDFQLLTDRTVNSNLEFVLRATGWKNKADMADPAQTAQWVEYFRQQKTTALPIDCKTGKGLNRLMPEIRNILREQIAAWERKGMTGRPIRIMVVGVPNVGKSSLINRLCKGGGAGKAAVQDKPGVTRRNQWFTIGKGFELLDTPGVLWPKFEDPVVGEHLAFTGAVRDEILDAEGLSYRLLELLQTLYPQAVNTRYKTEIDPAEGLKGHEILERIGRKRGMLIAGGEIDTERAAVNVLDEYRGGKLGRITLEPVGRPLT